MRVLRRTQSKCPYCVRDIPAMVFLDEDGCVYLSRTCPEHGEYHFLLSINGTLYADYDHYYFTFLKGSVPSGRLTNHWVFINDTCQMDCPYCEVELEGNYFEAMTLADFKNILPNLHGAKCTLTGGEPTTHPKILDFIRTASAAELHVTLATNGVALASRQFCEELLAAGVSEIRLSIESFDKSEAEQLGTAKFYEHKMRALENLEALQIPTTLSPTIFRGINEDQLIAGCEYAKDKPHIRSLSINGFAYFTNCSKFGHEHMMMPDGMAVALFKQYSNEPLENLYTFEKFIHTFLHMLGVRVCFYTPLYMLVRTRNGLAPITEFMALRRVKRMLAWWTKSVKHGTFIQRMAFLLVIPFALNHKAVKLLPALTRLLWANLFEAKVNKYPSQILSVVLNTNCSVLSLDATLAKQCMSSFFISKQATIQHSVSSDGLMDKETQQYKND